MQLKVQEAAEDGSTGLQLKMKWFSLCVHEALQVGEKEPFIWESDTTAPESLPFF